MCRFRLFFLFPLWCKQNYKSKMLVTLEPVQTEIAAEAEPLTEEITEEVTEVAKVIPEVEEVVPDVPEAIPETVQPKKRGRPKAAPKEKAKKPVAPKRAVRMKPSESSSDDDKLTHDDMGTLLLDYLVKRKTSQQNARRQMWSQLAGLS